MKSRIEAMLKDKIESNNREKVPAPKRKGQKDNDKKELDEVINA